MAPHVYRGLLIAGAQALARSGRTQDTVLFADLAPTGSRPSGPGRHLRPALFLRELFCLDGRYRRYRGDSARERGCGNLSRLRVLRRFPNLGVALHPYTRRLPPTRPFKGADSISIANIGALPTLLDRLARRTRLIRPGLPVYLTEFGYETNPPDTLHGIPILVAAEYENLGDYLAYREPRVVSQTHFQLADVPPQSQFPVGSRGYWRTFQSGLVFANGAPKLVAQAWSMPFVAVPVSGRTFRLWGQVRPAPNGQPQQVQLQSRVPGGEYQDFGLPLTTSPMGFFDVEREVPAGTILRAVWGLSTSRQVQVR
jgi:hypothetical protein